MEIPTTFYSSVDGHLGLFHFGALINNVAMKTCSSFCVNMFSFLEGFHILRSENTGSCANSMFTFLR